MERLPLFLYLLMRDEVPSGAVYNVIEQVEEAERQGGGVLSAPELAALAERYTRRLVEDDDQPTRQMQVVEETEAREHKVVQP